MVSFPWNVPIWMPVWSLICISSPGSVVTLICWVKLCSLMFEILFINGNLTYTLSLPSMPCEKNQIPIPSFILCNLKHEILCICGTLKSVSIIIFNKTWQTPRGSPFVPQWDPVKSGIPLVSKLFLLKSCKCFFYRWCSAEIFNRFLFSCKYNALIGESQF